MTPPLSPAAQAVVDAFKHGATADTCGSLEFRLGAALRVAADQVVPDDYDPPRGCDLVVEAFVDGKECRNEDIRYQLLAIARELENHQ